MDSSTSQKLLTAVMPHYNCTITSCTVTPLGNGLINHTYLIQNEFKTFVLQCLNHNVFPNPEQLVNNAELISQHLLIKQDNGQYPLEPTCQLAGIKGQNLIKVEGTYWRALNYIENCYTVESVSSTNQAEHIAKAFAQFTSAMSDFSAKKLFEIIPNFHNLDFRFMQLKNAVANDSSKRLSSAQSQIQYCNEQQVFINDITLLCTKLPLHVTHNDTKINNLLFSSDTHKPLAVIDLDTCMPGFLMNDFGDMVRTCCSNLAEDDKNLDKMEIRIDIFSALAKAYISGFNGKMNDLEKESLVQGALLLPFMIGIRFLTDYLEGDRYFHIKYPEHNLDRASNQFQLFKLLKEKKDTLASIIAD